MVDLVVYWWLVFRQAVATWWDFIWSNFVLAALLTLGAFILGAVVKSDESTWQTFRQWREAPMNNLHDLIGGGIGILALIGLSFLVCLVFIAPQQIHSEQLTALEKASADLGAARKDIQAKDALIASREPRLAGEIREKLVGATKEDFFTGSDATTCGVVALWIIVRNTGEPSIAENWKVLATLDGREVNAQVLLLRPDEFIDFAGKPDGKGKLLVQKVTREQMIMEKTVSPVPNGAAARGYFLVAFPGLTKDQANKAALSISFADIFGTIHECTFNRDMRERPPGLQGAMQGRP